MGYQCQRLEWVGVFSLQPLRGNGVCLKKQLLGGTSMSEVSEGLSTSGAGPWATAHVPDAVCCWGVSVCIIPKPRVRGGVVNTLYPANFSWTHQQAGRTGSGQGYQVGRGSVLVFRGIRGCGVPMGLACECMCLFAVRTKLDQTVGRGPVGW